MNNWSYGVLGNNFNFIHTSNSELGAKQYATRNGCTEVYRMHNVSWTVLKQSEKVNGKWVKI
jgi:hypothetical protein